RGVRGPERDVRPARPVARGGTAGRGGAGQRGGGPAGDADRQPGRRRPRGAAARRPPRRAPDGETLVPPSRPVTSLVALPLRGLTETTLPRAPRLGSYGPPGSRLTMSLPSAATSTSVGTASKL